MQKKQAKEPPSQHKVRNGKDWTRADEEARTQRADITTATVHGWLQGWKLMLAGQARRQTLLFNILVGYVNNVTP
jgi:hypothetical protein